MISLLPIIVAVFLLASLFKIAFIFHVLYVLVAVALLARLWTRQALRQLEVERRFESRALNGDSARITLVLRNRGWIPIPWLRLHDRIPLALATPANLDRVLSLGPSEVVEIQYETACRQRGWYELGPLSIELGDVLGGGLKRAEYPTPGRLTVYPRIVPVTRLTMPSRTPFGDIRTHRLLYEDPARTIGLRDYQSGDSLRRIHWRSSAAVGRLQVRKLEPAMTLQTIVALDLSLQSYDRGAGYYATELAVTTAASVASHLVSLRQEVGLLTNGADPAIGEGHATIDVGPRKGRDQLTRVLDLLARLQARECAPLDVDLPGRMGRLAWGSTLIVITGADSVGWQAVLGTLRRAGFALSFVLIQAGSAYSVPRTGAALLGIPVTRVWRESDLEHGGESGPQRRPARLAPA